MSLLQLQPQNSYKVLTTPFVIYITEKMSIDKVDKVVDVLGKRKHLSFCIEKNRKTGDTRCVLTDRKFCMNLALSYDNRNFSVCWISNDKRTLDKYNKPGLDLFLVELKGGIKIIYANKMYYNSAKPDIFGDDWKMDRADFDDVVSRMERHYALGGFVDEKDEKSKIKLRKPGYFFEAEVMAPFKAYTEKERKVAEDKAGSGDGVGFYNSAFAYHVGKGTTYVFYSNDPAANPEKPLLKEGDMVTLYDLNDKLCQTGRISEIDADSEESVKFYIGFLFQTNDVEIPRNGKMVLAHNDTQDKVRERVIRGISSGKVKAQYMYDVFETFSGEGYFTADYRDQREQSPVEQGKVQADLAAFLDGLLKETDKKGGPQYPPNEMQMEAIIKGILTKDMLLVLGPPGTGKTTVITAWVDYFVRKGMRVLISSQNNAAVDNVLCRVGEDVNVVRLAGDEKKVQENCRGFMPMHKQKDMQAKCQTNNDKILSLLKADLEVISQRKKRLEEYLRLISHCKEKKEAFEKDRNLVLYQMDGVVTYDGKIKHCLSEIDRLVEERAHKQIFIEENKKKNFLVRLFTKRYVKRATKELKSTEQALRETVTEYEASVNGYNKKVEALKLQIEQARKNGYYRLYLESSRSLESFASEHIVARDEDKNVSVIGISLNSELGSLYESFDYSPDSTKNESTANKEISHLISLEKSAAALKKAVTEWQVAIENGGNEIFEEMLISTCQVVGATCIGINSNKKFAEVDFDVAIVDESGQIQIHNALVPLSRAPKALMLGDYKQIPPCANEEVLSACENEGIDTKLLNESFFEFVFEKMREEEIERFIEEAREGGSEDAEISEEKELALRREAKAKLLAPVLTEYNPKHYRSLSTEEEKRQYLKNMVATIVTDDKRIVNLNSQFRMPGNISDVISEWFYESNYYSSYAMSRFAPVLPNTEKPMVVVNTANFSSRFEGQPDNKLGYFNKYEAGLVADIIEQVINSLPEENRSEYVERIEDKVGVISAYGAQVRMIRKTLGERKLGIGDSSINGMVASLDSFQGQERELIIYSFTRSKEETSPRSARVGFMKELRRLNVAFTRSKKQLVIIGDIDYLKKCLYMKTDEEEGVIPCCTKGRDGIITEEQINQCAECPVMECERKFARFVRLLMQHVENPQSPAGDLIGSENLVKHLKGGTKQC